MVSDNWTPVGDGAPDWGPTRRKMPMAKTNVNGAPGWTPVIRKLSDLIPWELNPREIGEAEAARLDDSLAEFNQMETIAIGPDNELYNGHQRLKVWGKQRGPDLEVICLQSDRALTEAERKRLTVLLHKGTLGRWDPEKLGSLYNPQDLIQGGFSEYELQLGDIAVIGVGKSAPRDNNNFSKMGMGEGKRILFEFGPDLKLALPREVYERVLAHARKDEYPGLADGILALFEAAFYHYDHCLHS